MIELSSHQAAERVVANLYSGEEQELFEYGKRFSRHIGFPSEEKLGPGIFDEVNARIQSFEQHVPTDMSSPKTAAFALGVFADVCMRLENGETL